MKKTSERLDQTPAECARIGEEEKEEFATN
jgi:hypothetical protein